MNGLAGETTNSGSSSSEPGSNNLPPFLDAYVVSGRMEGLYAKVVAGVGFQSEEDYSTARESYGTPNQDPRMSLLAQRLGRARLSKFNPPTDNQEPQLH